MLSDMTLEQARDFIKTLSGAPRRKLIGKEYTRTWTALQLMTPSSSYNNQCLWTDTYIIGNQDCYTEYIVTWFDEIPTIEIIEKEENDNE